MNKAYIENTIKFYNECIKAGLDIIELYDDDDCLGVPYPDVSGFEDTPEGFLGLFQNYLEGIIEQDPHNDNIKMYQHVLNHFDEVGVEDINEGTEDEPMFIPVIEDNSTAHYMDGQ